MSQNLGNISKDIALILCDNLSNNDLRSLSLVSRYWRKIILHDLFKLRHNDQLYGGCNAYYHCLEFCLDLEYCAIQRLCKVCKKTGCGHLKQLIYNCQMCIAIKDTDQMPCRFQKNVCPACWIKIDFESPKCLTCHRSTCANHPPIKLCKKCILDTLNLK
jgi:hypothetical protein